jgi:hypothetical protein
MAELKIMGDKGIIVKPGSSYSTFMKGDTIQFNGKTATNIYFSPGIPNVLKCEVDGRAYALTPEELAMVQKVTGGRKSRKTRKYRKNKSRRYRRV